MKIGYIISGVFAIILMLGGLYYNIDKIIALIGFAQDSSLKVIIVIGIIVFCITVILAAFGGTFQAGTDADKGEE